MFVDDVGGKTIVGQQNREGRDRQMKGLGVMNGGGDGKTLVVVGRGSVGGRQRIGWLLIAEIMLRCDGKRTNKSIVPPFKWME